ncbi:lipoprotein [Streptomyces mauvecolor]
MLAVTGAAATGLLTGCSGDSSGAGPRASETGAREAAARAEAALRSRTSATSRALVTEYDEVLAMHPALRPRLAPLRDQAAQHTTALAPASATTPSPSPSATSSPAAPAGVSAVATDADEAVKQLADAERRTSDAQLAALATAPPELARLLASVAASNAGHAFLLGGGA